MGRTIYPILVLVLVHAMMCSPGVYFRDDQEFSSTSNGDTSQQRSPTPESGQYTSHSDHTEESNQFRTETSSSSYNDNEHPSENQYTTESSSSSTHDEWSDHSHDGENQYVLDPATHATPSNDGYESHKQDSTTNSVGNEATPDSPKDADSEGGLDGATSDTESSENSQSKEHAEMAKIKPEKALGGVLEFDGNNDDIENFDFGLDDLFAEEDIDVKTKEILPCEWSVILANYLDVLVKQKQTKKIKYKIRKATELKGLEDDLGNLQVLNFEEDDPKKLQCAKMEYDVLSHIHHLSIDDQKYVFDVDKDGIPDFEVVEIEEPMKKKHKKRKNKKRRQNKAPQPDQNQDGNQSPGTDLHDESQSQNDGRQETEYVDEFHPVDNRDQRHDTEQYTDESNHEGHEVNENDHHDEPVYDVQVKPYTYNGEEQSRAEPQDGYSQQKQQEEHYKR